MKRLDVPVSGDLIVEPIEEAVMVYDELLKKLGEFMVSDFFLDGSFIQATSE
jgi:hypothetical protein